MKNYLLYNPLARNGKGKEDMDALMVAYENTVLMDITQITDYEEFFSKLEADDHIIICGGDGTLNRFANDTKNILIKNDIYFYSIGTGNDFARDLEKKSAEIPDYTVNEYINELPSVRINDEETLFINGVGYGIDGYCCEMGEKLRLHTNNPINYAKIAVEGLLFHYKPTNAVVTVDGRKYEYKNVWLAPTMSGRFYGGGMMCAPNQDRKSEKLTLVVMHGSGKLKTLMIFPSIFKGEHVRYKNNVTVLTGYDITVEFDRPTPLQVDGEVYHNVKSYKARSAVICYAEDGVRERT